MIDRSEPAQGEVIRVHRYPNRRLYDMAARKYVRAEDLVARIERGERVLVLDAQSGEDVTTSVLLPQVLEIFARTAAPWLTSEGIHRVIAQREEIVRKGLATLVSTLRSPWGGEPDGAPAGGTGGLEQRMTDLERMVREIARAVAPRRE